VVTWRYWNVLEYLDTEEEIKGFLEAALEEAPEDAQYYSRCLVKAAQARIVNQLAKEPGADRHTLCDMFLDNSENVYIPVAGPNVVANLNKAFAMPLPVPLCGPLESP
jgi:probable addiction module antidote protein